MSRIKYKTTLGLHLTNIMKQYKLTQVELADKLRISVPQLRETMYDVKYCNIYTLRGGLLKGLFEALRLSPDWQIHLQHACGCPPHAITTTQFDVNVNIHWYPPAMPPMPGQTILVMYRANTPDQKPAYTVLEHNGTEWGNSTNGVFLMEFAMWWQYIYPPKV